MKILLVDDDDTLAEVTSFALRRADFLVVSAHTGDEALLLWEQEHPDLILLDIQLPGHDGLSICQTIRAVSTIPIILLTVCRSDEEIVRGLELGADDYVTKPFSPKQLIARVRAVLRRSSGTIPQRMILGPLVLDTDRHTVSVDAISSRMTRLEFRLLHYLMVHSGQVVPTETILTYVWGASDSSNRMMLKQLVYRIRQKLTYLNQSADIIQAIPGIGYVFNTPTTR